MLNLYNSVGLPVCSIGSTKMLSILENIRMATRDIMCQHYSFSSAVVSLGQATDYIGTCVHNPTIYDAATLDVFLSPTTTNASTSYADRVESEMGHILGMQSRLGNAKIQLDLYDQLIPQSSEITSVQTVREALNRVKGYVRSLYNKVNRLLEPVNVGMRTKTT